MASKESKKYKEEQETTKKNTTRQIANPLSLETRLKVIDEYEERKTPFRDLAKKYMVSPSQIQRTLANKNKYLKKADSLRGNTFGSLDSPPAGGSIDSPIDGVDLLSRIWLERDLTESPPNIKENEYGLLMSNEGDSEKDSRSTPEKSEQENNWNFDDKSSNQSEYATSVSSEFSEDSVEDIDLEPTDVPNEQKSANRLFLEHVCRFMQKKKQQRAKWIARNRKLKHRLQKRKKSAENLKKKLFAQQEKAKKFEDMTIEMKNQKMVNCVKCGEMKPKLTFNFCSFKCFQGVLSPSF